MQEVSPWMFKGRPVCENDLEGKTSFVYLIEHKKTGKSYIGKKRLSRKLKRKPLKGKKRNRISYVESDWRDYFGSNDVLQAEVAEQGPKAFTRTILRLCKSLSESSYYEAKIQFDEDVLLHPDKWYNSWISCRLRSSHFK